MGGNLRGISAMYTENLIVKSMWITELSITVQSRGQLALIWGKTYWPLVQDPRVQTEYPGNKFYPRLVSD